MWKCQEELICEKTLTIYYLVDTGIQMMGDKIGSINSAMKEAITVDLPETAMENNDADIYVAIIQFSNGASSVTQGAVLDVNDKHTLKALIQKN